MSSCTGRSCLIGGSYFMSPRYILASCVRCQGLGRAGVHCWVHRLIHVLFHACFSRMFFALVLHAITLLALLACVWSCLDLGVFCPLLGWPRMEQTIFNMIVRGSEALFKKKYVGDHLTETLHGEPTVWSPQSRATRCGSRSVLTCRKRNIQDPLV